MLDGIWAVPEAAVVDEEFKFRFVEYVKSQVEPGGLHAVFTKTSQTTPHDSQHLRAHRRDTNGTQTGHEAQYPAANDPEWYFKSEILPNNIDDAEVSLSDYTDPYVPPTVGQTRLCGTQYGPIVCLRGHDFTANGQVNLQYANLPNFSNPYNDTTTADSTGTLNFDDHYDRGALAYCSQSQLSSQVTLTLTDVSTNQSSTIQFPATQFCANGATTRPACVPIYDGARYWDYTCP